MILHFLSHTCKERTPDMSRFAGLALLPRVCASQTDVNYQEVYEAVSLGFIWRLLVPLRDPRFIATIDSAEDVQKQLLGVTIALSVLSLLSRDQAVAQDPELIELVPSLTRLIRAPSLASACGRHENSRFQDSGPAEVHKDALELLWNLCTHSDDGLTIARQSNSISSVCNWLKINFMKQPASSSQCALSLVFTMLEPFLSQSFDAQDAPKSKKKDASHEASMLHEIHAAVSGIAAVCAADCSAMPSVSVRDESSISASLHRLDLANMVTPTREDAQSFQLKGFCILAATIPCLAWAATMQEPDTQLDFAWAEDVKEAVLRALRSRLPLHHLLHVLSVLHALSDLQGVHALLVMTDGPKHCDQRVTSLLSTMVQVLKVQVYSHLQGCVLHVQTAGAVSVLPESLHISEALFTISLRLLHKAVDLVLMIEDVHDGSDETSGPGTLSTNAALLAAKIDNALLQVLKAVEDSVLSMLDFVAFVAGGSVVDGPDPQQIPKGFRAMPATDEAETDCQNVASMRNDDQVDKTSADSLPRKVSAFTVQPVQGAPGEADWEWVPRTIKACCRSVGMLISLAGGVEACTKLLATLPDLCAWLGSSCVAKVRADTAETKSQLLAPIESLISALYSMHTLQVSGGSVAEACKKTLQNPDVFMPLGVCCVTIINRQRQHDIPSTGAVWCATLASETLLACELIASALQNLSKSHLRTVEQLYKQFGRPESSAPLNGLLPGIAMAGHELLDSLAVAMPAHVTSAVDGDEDAGAVVDAIGAVAALVSSAISLIEPHSSKVEMISALRTICGAFRIMLEFVLTVALGGHEKLVQRLVCAGQEESTAWRCAKDQLMLAHLHKGLNIDDVIDRCCAICGSICTTLETVPSLAGEVCNGTWIGAYLQNDADFERVCGILEQTGSSVSLGHALRLLAILMNA